MSDPEHPFDEMYRRGVAQLRAQTVGRKAKPAPDEDWSKPKRQHPERDLQKQIVGYVNRFVQGVVIAAAQNETSAAQGRTPEERARYGASRRASGVLSGHPDLVVYVPGGRVLLWELKSAKGTVSMAQHLVHARLAELGHSVQVIRTLEEALAALVRAGVPVPGRAMRLSTPVQPL